MTTQPVSTTQSQPSTQPSQPPKPVQPPPFRITSVKHQQRWLNLLIYGEYGVGKTTLAGSAVEVPDMRDVIFLDVEAGSMSLSGYPMIDAISINRYSTLARAYEYLKHHCKLRDEGNVEEMLKLEQRFKQDPSIEVPKQYRTVILDTLTEVAKYVMYQLLSVDVGAKKLDLEPDSPEFKEWNVSTEMVRLLIRSLRDLPMHVILVCSEKKEEVRPGHMVAGLNMTKALAREVPGFLDVVGYMVSGVTEDQSIERRLFLEPGRTYMAKHRFGRDLPAKYIEDPSMAKLLALMPK